MWLPFNSSVVTVGLLVECLGGFPPEQSVDPFLAAFPGQDYRGVPTPAPQEAFPGQRDVDLVMERIRSQIQAIALALFHKEPGSSLRDRIMI